MRRTTVILTALGLLALASGLAAAVALRETPEPQTLLNANTGAPVTLEAAQKDADWHRETAKKLRESR